MHTTTTSLLIGPLGSVDEHGRLVHEDDPAAQLALALANVSAQLRRAGLDWADLTDLRVSSTDVEELLGVYDLLTEHLASVGATPRTSVVEVRTLPVPGMTVVLDGRAVRRTPTPARPDRRMTRMTSSASSASSTASSLSRSERLATACPGRVHLPGSEEYEQHRTPWNVAVDQRPAAVAVPETAEEVARVVAAAARLGYRVAAQGTGHGAAALAERDLSAVVLVRTGRLADVVVDPVARRARVGSGALWQDVVAVAAEHGLAALHGSSPDVGVAGYCLGGGLGWYARKHGLAAGSVVEVELVTADGTLLTVDADRHPDLFWALRGGGGSFGVVTALTLELLPVGSAYAGMFLWDIGHAEPVLRTWAEWCRTAPEEVTTSFRVMRFPPMPQLPDFLRGRRLVVLDGAVLGDDRFGAEQVAAFRALEPEMDTWGRVPAAALARLHMDPEGPTPNVGGTTLVDRLDDAAVDAFLAAVGPQASPAILGAELRQLGGALSRTASGAGALDRIDAEAVAFFVAVAATPELATAGRASIDQALAALAPHSAGGVFLNLAEQGGVAPERGYRPEVWERLRAVRAAADPGGVLLGNHPVG